MAEANNTHLQYDFMISLMTWKSFWMRGTDLYLFETSEDYLIHICSPTEKYYGKTA